MSGKSRKSKTSPKPSAASLEKLLDKGDAYFEEGELEEAEAIYTRALALDPQSPEVLIRLGALLLETERYNEGVEYLRKVERLAPTDVRPLHLLGAFYVEEGEFD
jgi:Flp pilus assembly protein TadD